MESSSDKESQWYKRAMSLVIAKDLMSSHADPVVMKHEH